MGVGSDGTGVYYGWLEYVYDQIDNIWIIKAI